MWSLFKPLANLIDRSPDESVDRYTEGKYSNALGVVGWITLCLLVVMVFVCLTWWRGSVFKPVQYLSVEVGQKPQPLVTLAGPVYTTPRIQSWVANAISETLSFNFINIEQRIDAASTYYTPDAAAAMRGSIEAQDIVQSVKRSRLNVTVTPLSPPRLVQSLVINGEETWVVESPILLTYASSSSSESRNLLVSVKVKKVPASQSPDGLVITSFATIGYNK